jgi:hypothetical protein
LHVHNQSTFPNLNGYTKVMIVQSKDSYSANDHIDTPSCVHY